MLLLTIKRACVHIVYDNVKCKIEYISILAKNVVVTNQATTKNVVTNNCVYVLVYHE